METILSDILNSDDKIVQIAKSIFKKSSVLPAKSLL